MDDLETIETEKLSRSKADRRRRVWMRKHRAFILTYSLQLNRRPPLKYRTVYAVDWMTKNGSNIMGMADWGCRTKRQAIDKDMRVEARELKH